MKLPIRIFSVLLLACFTTGTPALAIDISCAPPASTGTATPEAAPDYPEVAFPEGDFTIFAAASLVDVFARIEADLESANPNLEITVETAGSQALVTQLTEGASADVLATANNNSMNNAIEAGSIEGEPVTFTGNRLVIVTPSDNPAGITQLADLGNDDVLLVIAGEEVPAGQYARNAICSGDAEFVAAVGENVVSEEENVRNVLAKVQLGEADAGIVYASDAAAANATGAELQIIEFPDDVPTAAAYPIAPVTGGNAEFAQAFIGYVLSEAGQQTLIEFGFSPAS